MDVQSHAWPKPILSNVGEKMNLQINIDGCLIGQGCPPYIVAEMSGNHNHDLGRALRIIDAAKTAGANAVKLQTYRADTITIDHSSDEFTVNGGLWDGRRLYELYEEAHTPWAWHAPLFEYARRIGITLFSSPFDSTAVDLLESLGAPAYKIASPELVDLSLIRQVARTGKPIILSTGAATLNEIEEAVQTAREAGATQIIVLHCTAAYPAPPEEANLSTITALAKRFNVVAGLSDHTMGTTVAALAVGLGASFIEKHFTLARSDGGVDSAFSLEPQELAELVSAARMAQVATGKPTFGPTDSERSVLKNRRSLYVVKPLAKGEQITKEHIRSIRPSNGLKPRYLDEVLGKRAARDLAFGEPLQAHMVEGWSEPASLA
jgi:N-acetylneuraminate synthase